MSVQVHIERMIVEGLPLAPRDGALLQAAVTAELSRLLSEGGIPPGLRAGGALGSLPAGDIRSGAEGGAARLGGQIAHALHGGLGRV